MTTDDFFNNGLDSVASLTDFDDLGRGGVTGDIFDNGKFRAPTLRNIALTAPYMHDGSIVTLEAVLEHYASGGKPHRNKSELINGFAITNSEKKPSSNF